MPGKTPAGWNSSARGRASPSAFRTAGADSGTRTDSTAASAATAIAASQMTWYEPSVAANSTSAIGGPNARPR